MKKRDKIYKIILWTLLIISLISCKERLNGEIRFHTENIYEDTSVYQSCRGYIMSFSIPKGSLFLEHGYEEGYYNTFLYPDSQYIAFHCGSMIELPHLKYNGQEENDLENNIVSRKGLKEGENLYWREDNYKNSGMTIMYDNINAESVSIFEKAMNNVNINKR